MKTVPLRRLADCLDGARVPLSGEERSYRAGDVPYWGANGIVDHVDDHLFDEPLVLVGEDGAPFFDRTKDVAFVVDGPIWPNNHIHVLRPASGVDPRFLAYSLNCTEYGRVISGSTRDKLTQDDMKAIRIPRRSSQDQRRIADFLDDRVARIDRIIAARREQADMVRLLPWTAFGDALVALGAPMVPLRRAIESLADGPFGSAFSSADYVDHGPAVIRLGNIGFAEFRSAELARIPKEIYDRFPLAHIRPGDLLLASLGDANNHAGRACVAPTELGTAMVKGKCYVARANPAVTSERFLSVLLSSPQGAEALVQQGTGATRSMLNFERLLSCSLPIPGIAAQVMLADNFEAARESAFASVTMLSHSIDLLTEYKTCLITAAVTGELDVTTAGSGVPA